MNRYELQGHLGDGTYGCVLKAVKRSTGEVVAIKKLKKKFGTFEECLDLREVRTLRDLSHPNIVKLIEVIRENDSTLFFVFEHMEANLYEMMKHYQNEFSNSASKQQQQQRLRLVGGFSSCGPTIIREDRIRSILSQVLQALAFMCERGYFHRDIKPENILVKNDVVKIADLGLAREIRSRPPYTDYVSTRWYRAPEVLLRSSQYNSPIDVFAVGCILAELYTLHPLFPGSSEIDQIYRIFLVLGAPTAENWPEGVNLVHSMQLNFSSEVSQQQSILSQQGCRPMLLNDVTTRLQNVLPQMRHRPEAVDLLKEMLTLYPKSRASAKKALEHPFFKVDLDQAPAVGMDDRYSRLSVISQPQPVNLPVQQHQQALDVIDMNNVAPLKFNPMQQWIDESKNCFSTVPSFSSSSGPFGAPLHQYNGMPSAMLPRGLFSDLDMMSPVEMQPFCVTQRESFHGGALLSYNESNSMDTSRLRCSGEYARGLGHDMAATFHTEGVISNMARARFASLGDKANPSENGFSQEKF